MSVSIRSRDLEGLTPGQASAHAEARAMNGCRARPGDADVGEPDPMAIVSPAELRLLVSDFESLVALGVLQGTRQEAAQFFSGWLARGVPSPLGDEATLGREE